jgi:hypothetical protein
MISAFLDALGADGPSADRAGKMDLYGRFVGSWDLMSGNFPKTAGSCAAPANGILAGRWRGARSRMSGSCRRAANGATAMPRPISTHTPPRCASDITAESFLWRGEISADNGATWRIVTEFTARRRPA